MDRRFPADRLVSGLVTLAAGLLIAWLPIALGAGSISGWLIGIPMAFGALLAINGIATLSELPWQVPAAAQRFAGLGLLIGAFFLWRLAPDSTAQQPLLQMPALRTYAGCLGLLGAFLMGTGSLKKASNYWMMSALAAVLMAPFAWMLMVSLHPPKTPIPPLSEIVPRKAMPVLDASGRPLMIEGDDGRLQPKTAAVFDPHWENFDTVLNSPTLPVRRFFYNTVFVTVTTVVLQLLITSLAAYGLSRLRFRGRDALFYLFIGSMMFAGPVTQIPVYLMLRSFGWLDTYMALIVPGVSSAFSVFLLRQFFLQIPIELDEAARIDGAGDWKIYSRVILPLSKPALATAAAFTFFGAWTDFFNPLIYTNSVEMRTLEVGLSIFKNSYGGSNWPLQMTAALIVLTPLLMVFLFVQRYFVRGIMLGSIK